MSRRKLKGGEGFSSLFLVMILGSLALIIFVTAEAAAGRAAAAISENLTLSAGRSVLSEFQPRLFERYGIFALRADDERLTKLAAKYIGENLENGRGLVRLGLGSCEVSADEHPALDTEAFRGYIKALGVAFGVRNLTNRFSSLKSAFSGLTEAEAAQGGYADRGIQASGGSFGGSVSAEESELRGRYDEAMDPDLGNDQGKLKTINVNTTKDLPTSLLGVGKTYVLALSGGKISYEAFLENEYIVAVCSNYRRGRSGACLRCETEYVLYGRYSDKENLTKLKESLFGLRFVVDLAQIYGDPGALSRLASEAAAFPMVPLPLAVFLLASAEAASRAAPEVRAIMAGQKVPLFKTGLGTYEDYVSILLLLLPERIKMARLMDIMQLDVRSAGGDFSFRDYAYGFELRAEFVKPIRIPLLDSDPEDRKGDFEKSFVYE